MAMTAKALLLALLVGLPAMAGCTQAPPPSPQRAGTNSTLLDTPGPEQVVTRDLAYFEGATGYLARPSAPRDVPGVVMVHEWWGLNDHLRDMARVLSSEGYAVLAVDLFHGSVATTSEQAQAQTRGLNQTEATRNLRAAVAYLREQERAPAIAGLGWCFGGGQSLQLALSGEFLDGTVIYYGSLVADESRLAAISWPVLGVFGDQDRSIPVSQVRAFEAALQNLSVPVEVHIYPGVGHAFANPSGSSYAPDETKDAWEKTLAFLARNLKGA